MKRSTCKFTDHERMNRNLVSPEELRHPGVDPVQVRDPDGRVDEYQGPSVSDVSNFGHPPASNRLQVLLRSAQQRQTPCALAGDKRLQAGVDERRLRARPVEKSAFGLTSGPEEMHIMML